MRAIRPPYDFQYPLIERLSDDRNVVAGTTSVLGPAGDDPDDVDAGTLTAYMDAKNVHVQFEDQTITAGFYLVGVYVPFSPDVVGEILTWTIVTKLLYTANPKIRVDPRAYVLGKAPSATDGGKRAMSYQQSSTVVRYPRVLPVRSYAVQSANVSMTSYGMMVVGDMRERPAGRDQGIFVGAYLRIKDANTALSGMLSVDAEMYDDVNPVRLPIGL